MPDTSSDRSAWHDSHHGRLTSAWQAGTEATGRRLRTWERIRTPVGRIFLDVENTVATLQGDPKRWTFRAPETLWEVRF